MDEASAAVRMSLRELPFASIVSGLVTALALALATARFAAAQEAAPVIAVAASLRPPVEAIVPLFEAATGKTVRVTYGATQNFVRQIEAGAPFEVILAADEASVLRLEAAGRTDGPSRVLVRGTLVVAALATSAIPLDPDLVGLKAALAGGRVKRIAIANPDLAPYGAAAREAMQAAGISEGASSRIALAENIGQAAQFVATGGAEVGFIAKSSAVSPELLPVLRFSSVRADWYRPLDQRMAVLKGAGPTARAFFDFLATPGAKEQLQKSGFTLP